MDMNRWGNLLTVTPAGEAGGVRVILHGANKRSKWIVPTVGQETGS